MWPVLSGVPFRVFHEAGDSPLTQCTLRHPLPTSRTVVSTPNLSAASAGPNPARGTTPHPRTGFTLWWGQGGPNTTASNRHAHQGPARHGKPSAPNPDLPLSDVRAPAVPPSLPLPSSRTCPFPNQRPLGQGQGQGPWSTLTPSQPLLHTRSPERGRPAIGEGAGETASHLSASF